MLLLVKTGRAQGLAAHIADTNGNQLCRIKIKRSLWQLSERVPEGITICAHCKRIQGRTASNRREPSEPPGTIAFPTTPSGQPTPAINHRSPPFGSKGSSF